MYAVAILVILIGIILMLTLIPTYVTIPNGEKSLEIATAEKAVSDADFNTYINDKRDTELSNKYNLIQTHTNNVNNATIGLGVARQARFAGWILAFVITFIAGMAYDHRKKTRKYNLVKKTYYY